MDSEKYYYKERDWNAPGNIKDVLAKLNQARLENRALHDNRNLRFHHIDSEQILFYSKVTEALDNILLVFINLDPHHMQSGHAYVPLERCGISEGASYQVHDLLTGERFIWNGRRNYVELDPNDTPAHIFRLRRWQQRERDFDYFM